MVRPEPDRRAARGVALEYRLDGGDWTAYAGPVVVRPDGAHTVRYRARDAAGNESAVGERSFVIDKPSETDGTLTGSDPATLSLTLRGPASFGAFTPGAARVYTAGTTAGVTSSAGDATLSVFDPSAAHTGRLVNGEYVLPSAVQVRAGTGAFAPVGGAASPAALLAWGGPVTAAAVAIEFSQSIGAGDALRSGAYGKMLTFTLSTTTP